MTYQPYVTGGNNNNRPNSRSPTRRPQTTTTAASGGAAYAGGVYVPGQSSTPSSNYGTTTTPPSNNVYQPSTTNTYANTYANNNNNNNNNTASSYGTPSHHTTAYGNTTASTPTNTYGNPSVYGALPPANTNTNTTARGAQNTNPLPDFSQALNLPPPATTSAAAIPSSSGYAPAPAVAYGAAAPSASHRAPTASGYATSTPSASAYGHAPPATNPGYSEAVAIPVNNTGGGGGGGYSATSAPMTSSKPGGVATSALNSSTYSGGPTGGLISEGSPTTCHRIDYEIKGHEMQLVEIELDPQGTVVAEAGAMMFLDEGIDFKTKFGDGSEAKEGFFKKLMNAGGRLLTGESLFITHFTNQGTARARVAFAAPYPGTILPMNLANLNGKLICQKDAFLCAAKGTKLSIHFNKKIGSGLFGGEGFILQKLQGDGMAFIHAGGMVIKRELRGEKLRLDTGCVVAFTEGIQFDVQLTPGLKSMLFGGEGLFLATLQGTGTVWMQSLPFSRFADRVIQHAPSAGGRRQGEGSALMGGFGDKIDGDGFGFKF